MNMSISYTNRFVANAGTRREIARAFVGHAQRMRGTWLFYLLVLVLFAVISVSGMDTRFGLRTRVAWSILYAIVPTAVVAALIATIGYLRTYRGSRLRLFEGAALESGFGENEMILRGPLAEVRLSYQGIRSITARRNFVFMRQHGSPLVSVYPRELFPDEALERILHTKR